MIAWENKIDIPIIELSSEQYLHLKISSKYWYLLQSWHIIEFCWGEKTVSGENVVREVNLSCQARSQKIIFNEHSL